MARRKAFMWNTIIGSGIRPPVAVARTYAQKAWALKHVQQCTDHLTSQDDRASQEIYEKRK